MSIALNVSVKDYATPAIAEKLARCQPERLRAIIGRPLAEFWRDRLYSLGTNKRGWPSTGFYERAARSVTHRPIASGQAYGVIIEANHLGLRQRWKGGPIKPIYKQALAIPISPVSYGKHPKDFPNLFLLKTPKGAYLVQSGESFATDKRGRTRIAGIGRAGGGNSARRQRASLNFLFKLSMGVTQQPDERVVPTNDEFAEVALPLIDRAIA